MYCTSFLDDIDRIATLNYEPSDEDVVRARLRTTGVQEYHFTLDRGGAFASLYRKSESYEPGMPMPIGPSAALEWLMYDVAGEFRLTDPTAGINLTNSSLLGTRTQVSFSTLPYIYSSNNTSSALPGYHISRTSRQSSS
jgi:hypothetical protein